MRATTYYYKPCGLLAHLLAYIIRTWGYKFECTGIDSETGEVVEHHIYFTRNFI